MIPISIFHACQQVPSSTLGPTLSIVQKEQLRHRRREPWPGGAFLSLLMSLIPFSIGLGGQTDLERSRDSENHAFAKQGRPRRLNGQVLLHSHRRELDRARGGLAVFVIIPEKIKRSTFLGCRQQRIDVSHTLHDAISPVR